jgi:hypothetical protein
MSAALTVAQCANPQTNERVTQLKGGFVKGQWTKEEDELVCKYVELYGTKQWARIAVVLPGRKGKQCRERWHNHLNPDINKEAWNADEDLKLVEAHLVSDCAVYCPGHLLKLAPFRSQIHLPSYPRGLPFAECLSVRCLLTFARDKSLANLRILHTMYPRIRVRIARSVALPRDKQRPCHVMS